MAEDKLCHCGQPLHYSDPKVRWVVEGMVDRMGEHVAVRVNDRVWLVPRHYIALHGLRAMEIPALGFREVS